MMDPSLQGAWAFPGTCEQPEEDYLHIFEDGRMVQINCQPQPAAERRVISLRGYPEDDGMFRVKTRPDTPGYAVHIRIANGNLEITYPDMILTGRPVDVRGLPAWYSDELAKAKWEDSKA